MTAFKVICRELTGLFADDGNMAWPILFWLLVCGSILPRLGLPSALPPLFLFAGLAVILARSVMRRTRR